eukprot:TRINITY_DN10456_c0_g1_i1.p1 TRINITY_DN10456_c0_g1~~TRINITY_DN10456_c0_g1_i1.p1  ORF type:complete len:650 (-),score=99.44 TRINITY_DN10456_c0_g1_i1:99-2048(-)
MPFVARLTVARPAALSVAAATAFFSCGITSPVRFLEVRDTIDGKLDRDTSTELSFKRFAADHGAIRLADSGSVAHDSRAHANDGGVARHEMNPARQLLDKKARDSVASIIAVKDASSARDKLADTETVASQLESTILELKTKLAALRNEAHNIVDAFRFMTEANNRPTAIIDRDIVKKMDSGMSRPWAVMADNSPKSRKGGVKTLVKVARRVWSPACKRAYSVAQKEKHETISEPPKASFAPSSARFHSEQSRPDEVVRVMSTSANELYKGIHRTIMIAERASVLSNNVLHADQDLRQHLGELQREMKTLLRRQALQRQQALKPPQMYRRPRRPRQPRAPPRTWRKPRWPRQPRAPSLARRRPRQPRDMPMTLPREPPPLLPLIPPEDDVKPMCSREPDPVGTLNSNVHIANDALPPPSSAEKPMRQRWHHPPPVTTITTVSKIVPASEGGASQLAARFEPTKVAEAARIHAVAEQQNLEEEESARDRILLDLDDTERDAEKSLNVTLCQDMAQRCTPKPSEHCKAVSRVGKDPKTGCWLCVKWSCPDEDEDSFVDEDYQERTADEHVKRSSGKEEEKRLVDQHETSSSDDRQPKAGVTDSMTDRYKNKRRMSARTADVDKQVTCGQRPPRPNKRERTSGRQACDDQFD